MNLMRERNLVVLMCVMGLASFGCGPRQPERSIISGVVTYKGELVPYADIVFEPVDQPEWEGFYCQGQVINGKYELLKNGPVVGKNRVEIHGYRMTNQKAPDVSGRKLDEAVPMIQGLHPYLPAKYNDATELEIEVLSGPNIDVNFKLD